MLDQNPLLWVGFYAVILALLLVDNDIFNRKDHRIGMRQALLTSAMWLGVGIAVGVFIFIAIGRTAGLQYFTAYLIEKSLSTDNLFVFMFLFGYFKVAEQYRHKTLFWGIIGAKVMRTLLLLFGAGLVALFHPIVFLLGGIVLWTAWKMAHSHDEDLKPEENAVVRKFEHNRWLPIYTGDHGGRFFVREKDKDGNLRLMATMLMVALVAIEVFDVLFAFDSIPAVLAVTTHPFVAVASNVCAILGLRAYFFFLERIMPMFRYLEKGVVIVLTLFGLKMLLPLIPISIGLLHTAVPSLALPAWTEAQFEVPTALSLAVVVGILVVSVLLSVVLPNKAEPTPEAQ